ncbi:apolipoprotein N-acyltransferase [Loktanella fryxellensis]|uniref:Apolipoprotein N-acyltransferase n=1 Tax=Loktanella fryxellensis TaxID=245187 RepID=A0A1H8ABN3_9RHOB|nr:apolipoprotein N-acyltransferase [Loktanella fryxellensis]SEM67209.1 apolipoprotein N-acyltransferase [Loktanella fryxellensis]
MTRTPQDLDRHRALPTDRLWRLGRWPRAAALVLLGILVALGMAPLDWWIVAVPAWGVVLAVLAGAPGLRAAGFAALFVGLGYFGFTLRWLIEPFLIDAATWGWAAPLAVSLMALRETLFWVAGTLLARWLTPAPGTARLMALVLSLTLAEALRGYLFTGFPWGLIGHVLIPTPWAQLAAHGGPHLLTLLVLTVAAGLVMAAGRRWAGFVPLIAAVGMAPLLVPPPVPGDPAAPVIRIVQPNAPQDQKWDPAQNLIFFQRMIAYSQAAPRPAAIVWPETAVPVLLDYAQPELGQIAAAAAGVPLVTGVNRSQDGLYYNSLVVVGAGGQVTQTYDKAHLVPFGEYVPFGEVLLRLGVQGLATSQGGGFAKGPVPQPLIDLPGIGAARALICYEGIFAEEIATPERPRLLMMITNDAWFGKGAGPAQHLMQARLRSIEQGLPMVRSANTGISAMIDAHGRIRAMIPLDQAGYVDAALPAALGPTAYVRWGDWPVLALVLTGLAALAARRRWRR